jgi:Ser/Thr protein kinase RdoA (MazF antagonist)
MIVKASPGKQLTKTTAFHTAGTDKAALRVVVEKAIKAGLHALNDLYKKTRLNHNDVSLDNVLFDDNVSQAYLIDFGEASEGIQVCPLALIGKQAGV